MNAAMDSRITYLLSLGAIRDRAKIVWEAAQAGALNHFDLHEERLESVTDFVAGVLNAHCDVDVERIGPLVQQWKHQGADDLEVTRRLVDLFLVSVLLDAGAGDVWRYVEPGSERLYERSEGLAVGCLYMFTWLVFAENKDGNGPVVDGRGLQQLKTENSAAGFQASEKNPILGLEHRADLLRKLGDSLLAHPDIFGSEGRPGNLVDHLLKTTTNSKQLDVLKLWTILQSLLLPTWPKDRTVVLGVAIGDAWPLKTLQDRSSSDSHDMTNGIQLFHKLTQWVAYSLLIPFEKVLGLRWSNTENLTVLSEYRNGGLFVDHGVLTLKKDSLDRGLKASTDGLPIFDAGDDVVVEWRALTVTLIDILYPMVLARLGKGISLSMPQFLGRGSWKSGRDIAALRRPEARSNPIVIKSDGTLF